MLNTSVKKVLIKENNISLYSSFKALNLKIPINIGKLVEKIEISPIVGNSFITFLL
jgi:hypothetical protein